MSTDNPTIDQGADLPELDAAKVNELQNQAAALQGAYSEERDLVNQLLGQAQMAGAFEDFSRTVRASKLAYVKENKLYRAIAGKKTPHGAELRGTWEEFCNLLGRSVDQVDRDIANLKAFGEEALESMSRMGIGYREMRQFRRLPEDQKTALIEVAQTGDKEAFVELAEEIITRHSKEKEQLTKDRDDARADYEAQGELLAQKSADLDAARLELEKTRKRIQSLPSDERMSELRREVATVAFEAEATLMGKLRHAFDTLSVEAQHSDTDERLYMAGLLRQVEIQIAAIRDDYDLPESVDGSDSTPAWLDPEKAAQVTADIERLRDARGI